MKRRFRRYLQSLLLRPEGLFRLFLKLGSGNNPGAPNERAADLPNAVLLSGEHWQAALAETKRLHLPTHRDEPKNWDHLAAIKAILQNCPSTASILDAGAELYSNVLPALFLLGFHRLYGINLSFQTATRRGPIHYLPGDITELRFDDSFFDFVTCMSVIEHGVPLAAYFREMFRVLKPGGHLITSTDYFPTPVHTHGLREHGAPLKIFTEPEVQAMLQLATSIGFEQTGPLHLSCSTQPICWAKFDLQYTFLIFTLRKPST